MGKYLHNSLRLSRVALLIFAAGALCQMPAQDLSAGYIFGGATFGKIDGAGRFGGGLDFRVKPRLDMGVEVGTIHKHDVGILGSGNLTFHFNPRSRGRDEWDPFFVGGVSAARLSGVSGLYVNLGAGVNYWMDRNWGLRAEFKGYPGGQDLGGFAEIRFGLVFR